MKKEEQPVVVMYFRGVLSITSSLDAEKSYTYGFKCAKAKELMKDDYEDCKRKMESKQINGWLIFLLFALLLCWYMIKKHASCLRFGENFLAEAKAVMFGTRFLLSWVRLDQVRSSPGAGTGSDLAQGS